MRPMCVLPIHICHSLQKEFQNLQKQVEKFDKLQLKNTAYPFPSSNHQEKDKDQKGKGKSKGKLTPEEWKKKWGRMADYSKDKQTDSERTQWIPCEKCRNNKKGDTRNVTRVQTQRATRPVNMEPRMALFRHLEIS